MRRIQSHSIVFWMLVLALASCTSPAREAQSSILEQAAQEATRIVQEAQATALVIQAQAEADRISDQVNALVTPPSPAPSLQAQITSAEQQPPTTITAGVQETGPTEEQQVEIVRVSYAADGGFITIYFHAPPEIAEGWWQGDISIIEEGTETEYNEVPVMPKIGPLISKPQVYGQVGYVLLVNNPPGLEPGAIVTVILGEYKFEHVIVE